MVQGIVAGINALQISNFLLEIVFLHHTNDI